MDYEANAANEVQDFQNGGFFAANSLNKQIVRDPENNRTITFMDKRERVVMTRRDSIGGSEFIEIYRLHDDKNRPTKIIPPDATLADVNLIYTYLYNEDDQVIEQKIPDKAVIRMQYDERELLTAMQDGVMRDSSRWLVSNYDDYGRVIRTGFFQDAMNNPSTENPMINNGVLTETRYDLFASRSPINYGRIGETKSALLDGYRPTGDFIEQTFDYDAYGRLFQEQHSTPQFPLSIFEEITQIEYDFADNIVFRGYRHTQPFTTSFFQYLIRERMFYDHKGRMVDAFHQINDDLTVGIQEHCSSLEYGVRDLVTRRKLGGLGNGDFLQWVDYRYNAQRWLTQINSELPIGLSEDGDDDLLNTEPLDLFYMKLNYDNGLGAINSSQERSGNVSNMVWQTLGEERRNLYGYRYDFLDRIRRATYGTENSTQQFVTDDFGASYAYDARGNIINLKRKARNGDTVETIDSLTYDYIDDTNRLLQIEDGAGCPTEIVQDEDIAQSIDYRASQIITLKPGFSFSGTKDGVMTAKIDCSEGAKFTEGFNDRTNIQIYVYDQNGNLIFDPDKQVSIKYNHLNLPYETSWNVGGVQKKIEWLYDANGTKWQKLVTEDTIQREKRDYYAEIEYSNDSLEAVYHSEGRAVLQSDDSWEYQYLIKDYLSNTRVVFRDDGNGETEIISNSSYYPFGLKIDALSKQSSPLYSYLYNGKELNNDFGLDWIDYGERMYDSKAGRFIRIDPLTQEYSDLSPYSYVANSPTNAIDIDGRRILFVNGHWQRGVRGVIIGSYAPKKPYWGKGFESEAKRFFNDYSTITDVNYIDGSSKFGIDESGRQRKRRGYRYAKANYDRLTQGLAEGETFKLVTHSEGSAYGEGIAEYLIEKGHIVEKILHLSPDEGDEFIGTEWSMTYELSYGGDLVTRNKRISQGVDIRGIVDKYNTFGEKARFAHGSTKGAAVFQYVEAMIRAAANGTTGVNITETQSGIRFEFIKDNTDK